MGKKLRDFLIDIAEKRQQQISDTYWDIEKELDELFSSIEGEFSDFSSEEEVPSPIVYH